MAYANLINETLTAGTTAEWYMRFRDFVCKRNGTYDYSATGIGWTLHDSSYATDEDNVANNDYFVIYSAGESTREQMYFQIILYNTDYVRVRGWQYWNNSTHTGSGIEFYSDEAIQVGPDPDYIWVYGDLDFVHMISVGRSSTTTWSSGCFGCLDMHWLNQLDGYRNVQICSSSLSAGSDVSIVVPDSSSGMWQVGNKLMIMDNAEIEQITVKTNNGTTTITADLTNSYSANAKLAVFFPYFTTGRHQTLWVPFRSGYCVVLHGPGGTVTGTNEVVYVANLATAAFVNLTDPGGLGGHAMIPYYVYKNVDGHGLIGTIPHVYYLSGTGLTKYDLLDDLSNPDVQWRYNSDGMVRAHKEV